jgi:hypothetical protein
MADGPHYRQARLARAAGPRGLREPHAPLVRGSFFLGRSSWRRVAMRNNEASIELTRSPQIIVHQ